ncbi:2269_t:CDS:2, partial [Cetraspora pellucida]
KPVTRKTRNTKKKVNVTLVESDISEHSDELPKSKKPRKSNKTKNKENIDLDLETNELDNLQSKAHTNCQPNRPPSVESQSQYTYAENSQNQISQVHESPNHRDNTGSLPFTTNKYQYKIPQINERSTNPRVQSSIDPLLDQPNNYGKRSSNQIIEPGIDPLLDPPN